MLELRGVSLTRGGKPIVDDITLSLAPGEIVALAGPNGAGKTTLIKILAGIAAADRGDVLLDGRPLARLGRDERARRIAYLPQERRIEWALSVSEVVGLACIAQPQGSAAAVARALELAAVAHLADRSVESLSGGEQARVLFARALAVGADYLLADEPVMALDPRHQLALMATLRHVAADGTGIMLISHDLTHIARFADRVALLDQGRLVAAGTPDAVLAAASLARLYAVDIVEGRHEDARFIVPWRERSN